MRDPDKGGIMAVVSVDRGPPFGLTVVVARAGKDARAGVTGYSGEYEFVNLAPGDYDVDFYYGDHFVERKKVIVAAGEVPTRSRRGLLDLEGVRGIGARGRIETRISRQ